MKKVLLGTTALAVAGMVAGGAANAAEEPITAGIGGYYKAAMPLKSQLQLASVVTTRPQWRS